MYVKLCIYKWDLEWICPKVLLVKEIIIGMDTVPILFSPTQSGPSSVVFFNLMFSVRFVMLHLCHQLLWHLQYDMSFGMVYWICNSLNSSMSTFWSCYTRIFVHGLKCWIPYGRNSTELRSYINLSLPKGLCNPPMSAEQEVTTDFSVLEMNVINFIWI